MSSLFYYARKTISKSIDHIHKHWCSASKIHKALVAVYQHMHFTLFLHELNRLHQKRVQSNAKSYLNVGFYLKPQNHYLKSQAQQHDLLMLNPEIQLKGLWYTRHFTYMPCDLVCQTCKKQVAGSTHGHLTIYLTSNFECQICHWMCRSRIGLLAHNHTRDDDETRRIDGSVHDNDSGQVAHAHASSYQAVQSGTGQMPCILWMVR